MRPIQTPRFCRFLSWYDPPSFPNLLPKLTDTYTTPPEVGTPSKPVNSSYFALILLCLLVKLKTGLRLNVMVTVGLLSRLGALIVLKMQPLNAGTWQPNPQIWQLWGCWRESHGIKAMRLCGKVTTDVCSKFQGCHLQSRAQQQLKPTGIQSTSNPSFGLIISAHTLRAFPRWLKSLRCQAVTCTHSCTCFHRLIFLPPSLVFEKTQMKTQFYNNDIKSFVFLWHQIKKFSGQNRISKEQK